MSSFIGRHPVWSLAIIIAVAILLFLIFAIWPPELEQAIGRKRLFLSALLNGITLGGLYFLVASGFTLIFGLMRNVNLAHGSLYLFGGYLGYEIAGAVGTIAEASDLAAKADIDLAILDVNLDGKEIYPVADILAQRGLPFVFVSGYGEGSLAEAYRGLPSLQKPFQADQLETALKALLK